MKLNYKEFGSGKPLIILHGLLGSLDNWQTLARRFAEHFKVFTIDQRNHGQSPHSDEMNYEILSDDLEEFIKDHNLQSPVLIGHSMGGKTAMYYTLTHPDSVTSLIVADIAPRAYPIHHDHIIDALQQVDFNKIKTRKEAEEILMTLLNNNGIVQFLSKNIYWVEKDKLDFRFNLDVLSRNLDLISGWPHIEKIYTGRTLFIRGKKANYINDTESEINVYFPNSEIVTMDTGHWIHAEKPEEFYNTVLKFLS